MPGSSLFGGHDTGICQSAAGEESEAVRGSGQFLRHVSSRVFPVCEWHALHEHRRVSRSNAETNSSDIPIARIQITRARNGSTHGNW